MEPFLPWQLATVSAILLSFIFLRNRIFRQSTPPGSFGWPLIGETLSFLYAQRKGNPKEFFTERVRKYGRVFTTSLIGSPTVVFCSAEGSKFLFSNENKLVALSWPPSVSVIFAKSMFAVTGNEAKRIRKILNSFLRPEALRNFIGKVDSTAQSHFGKYWVGKQHVTAHPLIKKLAFQVACSLFTSTESEEEQNQLMKPFEDMEKGILQLPINIPGTRFHRALLGRDAILEKLDKQLHERREALNRKEASPTQDLLSYLICNTDDNGLGLTDEEIKYNIFLLLYAGHDTVNSTLIAIIKLLAENPECYERVLQEQLEILASKQKGKLLDWEDLQKMTYTWRAAQEALRLHPPVQGGFRTVLKEFTYEGFKIHKGLKVYWTVNSTHKNPEHFDDPERFNPERFDGDGPKPYTFIPFGGGARVCPGVDFARMEILVFIHNLVTMFDWEMVDPSERIVVDPMPEPTRGLPLKLHPRLL